LILFPYNANLFTYLTDPQHGYAEFTISLGSKTIVIAKNSGTAKVSLLLDRVVDMQLCQPFDTTDAFEQRTRGLIPARSYAVIIAQGEQIAERHVVLNDIEVRPSNLRLTTPNDETQYYFAVGVVIGITAMLTWILSKWWFEDAAPS